MDQPVSSVKRQQKWQCNNPQTRGRPATQGDENVVLLALGTMVSRDQHVAQPGKHRFSTSTPNTFIPEKRSHSCLHWVICPFLLCGEEKLPMGWGRGGGCQSLRTQRQVHLYLGPNQNSSLTTVAAINKNRAQPSTCEELVSSTQCCCHRAWL